MNMALFSKRKEIPMKNLIMRMDYDALIAFPTLAKVECLATNDLECHNPDCACRISKGQKIVMVKATKAGTAPLLRGADWFYFVFCGEECYLQFRSKANDALNEILAHQDVPALV